MTLEYETRSADLDYYKHYYTEDYVVNLYKSRCLSIEDMRTIFDQRETDYSGEAWYDRDLLKDDNTGLLYTDYDFIGQKDLLAGHLLLEQMYAQKDQVDWKRVTYNYDYEAIDRIEHMLITPLIWVPSKEAAEYCVVSGKVAKEVDTPEGYQNGDRYHFCKDLRENGLLWFADNLPEHNEKAYLWRYHYMLPKIVLWDKLLQTSFKHFRSDYLIRNLKFIAKERGVAKVVEIVDRFRKDWPYIEMKELFGINGLDDWEKKIVMYNKDTFFNEIGLHIAKWEEEMPRKEAKNNSTRGPKETTLFKNAETEAREKKRFTSFIKQHKMKGDDVDATLDNRVNQVAVCFYREWQKRDYLKKRAEGTSLTRFIKDCGLSISVREKAHANKLNMMIKSEDYFTDWLGIVKETFIE